MPRGEATRRPLPATREGMTTMPPTTAMVSPALRERRRQGDPVLIRREGEQTELI